LSVDPLSQSYPWFTPYQYASNNPILNIDLDGLEGRRYPLTTEHRAFINDIALSAYQAARNKGYSVHGAIVVISLMANESGYGNKTSRKYNNYFGIGGATGLQNYAQPDITSGIEYGLNFIESNFPCLNSELAVENINLGDLDAAFNEGRLGKYNTNPEGATYSSWLASNITEGLINRTLQVIDDNIITTKKQIDDILPKAEAARVKQENGGELTQEEKGQIELHGKLLEQLGELKEFKDEITTFQNEGGD